MTTSPRPPQRQRANPSDLAYGVQSSRRLLIDTIRALADFGDAITVVGAHAVHVGRKARLDWSICKPPVTLTSPSTRYSSRQTPSCSTSW